MDIRLLKLRYRLAALQSKASLFARHPAALLFYFRHYSVEKRVLRRVAVTVVSYPKAGRTWLEQVLLAALAHHRGLRFGDDATYTKVASSFDDLPLVAFTHAGGSWETATYTAGEIARHTPRNIVDGRFVYLYRDPRDTLVSAYHHARNRSDIAWLKPQDMLDDPIMGLPKLVAFMNHWQQLTQGAGPRALRMPYERLKDSPREALVELCRFIGLPFSENDIRMAIAECSFERMQERERAADGANPWLAPVDPKNPNSYKFREGRSGGYKAFFTPDQIRWIEDYMAEHLLYADEFLKTEPAGPNAEA